MNKRFSLHFRIYTRQYFEHESVAEQLCKKFLAFGDDLVPTHYSANEPIRTEFDRQDLQKPATLLSTTARHLLLKRSKPSCLVDISWFKGRYRPWFWTFDFGKEWLNGDKPKQIASFIAGICSDFPPVFATGGLTSDWFEKHEIVDPASGKALGSAGASFNPGTGLPGIYWFNFFGKELTEFFGWEKLLQLGETTSSQELAGGVCLFAYPSPDQHNAAWRREAEENVVNLLGKEYFFDLTKAAGKRPRKRTPIPGATDAKSFRH
jgi:hypothetical protein